MTQGLKLLTFGFLFTSFFAISGESNEPISYSTVRSFISAANTNSLSAQKKFIENNYNHHFLQAYPLQRHLSTLNAIFRDYGEIKLSAIKMLDQAGKYLLVSSIVQSSKTEEWKEIILYFPESSPSQITGVQIKPADYRTIPVPSNVNGKRSLVKDVAGHLNRLSKKDLFSGTVLIAKNGKVIYTKSFGLSNRRYKIRNQRDTKYNLGSMNKMFTSVGIMQLVEQDKIRLDETIDKYVDSSWLNPEVSSRIQIKHLLSHTAGLGDYLNNTFERSSKDAFREIDDYKTLVRDEALKFEPGTKYSYSNTGMFLLGVIIEKASGQGYFDYIKQNVYEPAGMAQSGSFELDKPVPNIATGYYFESSPGSTWRNNNYRLPVKGCPAGGGYSTAEDLLKFALALMNNRLISPKSREQMFKVHTELSARNYGFGFEVRGPEINRIVGHNGTFAGVSSNMDIFLDKGYVVVVLSNQSRAATPIVQRARALISQL